VLIFCPLCLREGHHGAFAKSAFGAGKTFDAKQALARDQTAIEQGMADAWADFAS
jgi:hypothetical protein